MSESRAGSTRQDIYRSITDRIVLAIQRGALEFEMPWHQGVVGRGRPVNACTDIAYRGVNVVALWVAAELEHFDSRYWATYKQWHRVGAQVRAGERGSLIVFYKEETRAAYDDDTGEVSSESYLVARASFVFNADQVDGWLPPEDPTKDHVEPHKAAEALVATAGADIRHGGDVACYVPTEDLIRMPDRTRFTGTPTCSATEAYYAVLLHELAHWTGHRSRLNRDFANRFGDHAYAMEELVAELGAAFLCADLRVSPTPRPDHAAYIASWLDVLKQDKKAFFTAASRAAAAAEFLLKLQDMAALQSGSSETEISPV
ncbi:MAG TPA: zincin-like metallopeptidase domain-containing protein [Fimbriimonadaceae bacterium]|nr:zincin-like metallopeptidase domain-containing protein [Fimbriimonadaceae bacterium]